MNNRQTILGILLLTVGTTAGLFWLDTFDANGSTANSTGLPEPPALTGGEWARFTTRHDLDSDLVAILQSLQIRLETQQATQDAMAEELARLRPEMDTSLTGLTMNGDGLLTTSDVDYQSVTQADSGNRSRRDGDDSEERLVEAGFSLSEAQQIAERMDSIAMERLNLRYEVARDGGIDRQEYRESIAKLPSTREVLQTTYGDDAYDRYLYASGRPNRLVVRDVYQGSAAEDIGLLPGDMVLSWDNQRVYSSRDLRSIATNGSSGESVLLTIQRNGSQFELYMPRGPLGITTNQTSVNPTSE